MKLLIATKIDYNLSNLQGSKYEIVQEKANSPSLRKITFKFGNLENHLIQKKKIKETTKYNGETRYINTGTFMKWSWKKS